MERSVAVAKMQEVSWDELHDTLGKWTLENNVPYYSGTPVSDEGFLSAGENFGLFGSVMREFGNDFGRVVLDNLFEKRGELAPIGMSQNGRINRFVKHGTKFVSPNRILDILYETIPGAEPNKIFVGDKAIEIYCTGKKVEKAMLGDPVQCGVYVAFSPFGLYAPDVTSFFNHLVCTNGMLSSRNFMTLKRAKNDEDVYDWIANSLLTAYTTVDDEMARLMAMKEQRLNGNRDAIIAHMFSTIPSSLRTVAMEELAKFDRPIVTAYDVYYFVTWFASHFVNNPKHMRSLMLSAGDIPEHVDVCPACHREI